MTLAAAIKAKIEERCARARTLRARMVEAQIPERRVRVRAALPGKTHIGTYDGTVIGRSYGARPTWDVMLDCGTAIHGLTREQVREA